MFGLELVVKNICFFFGCSCSVDPGRGDCPSRNESENHCGQCWFDARIFYFSIELSVGCMGLWYLLFFFSFLRMVSPIGVPDFIHTLGNCFIYLSWNTGKGTALGIYLGGLVFYLY